LIVAGVIATLKVALRAWLIGTPVAPLTGTVEITVGGVGAGTVLMVHTYLLVSGVPARLVAAVLMAAVYNVFTASSVPGANVAMLPIQLTVPATAVAPGPVTVKVVAGDAMVMQFIASLKVALSTWLTSTPVAVFTGTVAITVGAGVMVVKLHT
jgi:hypothetical protein